MDTSIDKTLTEPTIFINDNEDDNTDLNTFREEVPNINNLSAS